MAAKNCEDCGVKLTMLNRHLKYKEKCHPCGHKEFVHIKEEREKPRVCLGCGGQIDRAEKHWVIKNGSGFLCNACHEDPNRQVEGRLCSDCGGQLESAEKSWRLKDGSGFLCNACNEERKKKEEPRFCSDCETQIDTAEKHWVLKDGAGFLCNACNEERTKKAAVTKQVKADWEYATYLGGFSGVTSKKEITVRFEATQVAVERYAVLGQGQVLWVMPYNKIKDVRIDTAEHLTAARLLLTGILAFGLKKKERYLIVSFEDQNGLMQHPAFEGKRINKVQKNDL